MSYRQIAVKLPPDLSPERYAAITHAVYSVIDAAGLAADAELNQAFDTHSAHYPWGL